jgi:hypothetical protein
MNEETLFEKQLKADLKRIHKEMEIAMLNSLKRSGVPKAARRELVKLVRSKR